MRVVLLLDWSRVNIAQQVSKANHRMDEMTREVGLAKKVVFNLASLGAGEWMTDMAWLPNEEPDEQKKLNQSKLDMLRRFHWRVKQQFEDDIKVRENRETREMVSGLKQRGHTLTIVWPAPDEILDTVVKLKDARALDFFEQQLNDVIDGRAVGHHEGALDRRLGMAITNPRETIIVSDFPEGVESAKKLRECAVVGYVPSNQDFDQKGLQLKALASAGADYALIGGYTVSAVPDMLARKQIMKKIMAGVSGPH
ncbi:MAG: hypothetical protein PHX61_12810 [Alphaproteobacteria bacterium]|nr:hypothetical protein [Alphaproteobacteria bacterium]